MAALAPTQEVEEEGPNKRPRLWEQQQQQQRRRQRQQQAKSCGREHDDWKEKEGEDSTGCACSNAGCPWSFRSSSRRAASTNGNGPVSPPSTPHAGGVGPNDGGDQSDRLLPPRQFFDGPLLSVKEYRDQPTGEVRFAVFQGDRRVSVAQILFSLKRGEDDHAYGHVKSVRVHRDFRGMGLGPLLFKEVFATLGNLSVTEVRLEAEEDMCKYNHLVRYYEDLGFRQLEGSKVHYVHHCDQVYRKIRMLREVSAPAQPRFRRLPRLVDSGGWFLVVRLQTKAGGFVRSTASGNVVSPHASAGGAAAAAVASGGGGGGGDGGGGGGGGCCEVEGCCGGSGGTPTAGGGAAAVGCSARGGGGAAEGSAEGENGCTARGGGGGEGGHGAVAVAAGEGRPSQDDGGVRRGGQRKGESESAERTAMGAARRRGGRGGGGGGGGGGADDLWTLTVSEVRGVVCFESAYGKYLCVEPDGKVVADRSWDDSWEQFSLERFAPELHESPPAPPPPSGLADDADWTSSCTAGETQAVQQHERGEGGHGATSQETGTRQTPPSSAGGTWDRLDCRKGGGGGGGGDPGAAGGRDEAGRERGEACTGEHGRPQAAVAAGSSPSGSFDGGPGQAAGGDRGGGGMPTTRFALRTYHGQYLSLDAEFGTVSTSAQPVLWSTDEKNSICHCEGAVPWAAPPPASRWQVALQAHLRSMRQVQNVSFVTGTRNKYMSSFGRRGRFSVKDALDLLHRHHDPLQSTRVSRLSFAALLVLTAQDIRDEGLPDWMQAIGLVHGLGRILHFLGEDAGVTETERECALGEYSWVVGAPFPDSITCESYNVENDDALDERYGAGGARPTGMYDKGSGLDNALLCFTGPEYMHMVLRNHGTSIPPQGLAMLRLYPLEPWHAGGCYSDLESAVDKDTKNVVTQFDAIRRATLHSIAVHRREVNLERAWYEHLKDLVDKFFPGDLAW